MESVQMMIRHDGKKQIIIGSVCIVLSALFLTGFLLEFSFNFLIDFFFFVTLAVTGTTLIRTGYSDWVKSQQPMSLEADHMTDAIDTLPSKMFLQLKREFESDLYDFSGESYFHVSEQWSSARKVIAKVSQWVSTGSMRPAVLTLHDQNDQPFYQMERKGGFSWRSYVKSTEGYVAYTARTKNKTTGQVIYKYVEHNKERWKAEGDHYIGHFTITDGDGEPWVVIKRGAVNKEVPEMFQTKPGYLVEWKHKEEIPYSLIAFIFIIQSHDHV